MICPECGEEIDHVDVYVTEENRYWVYPDGKYLVWEDSEHIPGTESKYDVCCPECDKILDSFVSEEELEIFVKSLE